MRQERLKEKKALSKSKREILSDAEENQGKNEGSKSEEKVVKKNSKKQK